jgi:hypothetical protein
MEVMLLPGVGGAASQSRDSGDGDIASDGWPHASGGLTKVQSEGELDMHACVDVSCGGDFLSGNRDM